MDGGRETQGEPASAEEADPEARESTLSDEEWPVSDLYRVDADAITSEGSAAERLDETRTRVLSTDATPGSPLRRIPRDVAAGILVAIVAAALVLVAGGWLLVRDDEDAGSTPARTAPETTAGTTTETGTASSEAIPEVVGLTLAEARARLEAAGLESRVRRVDSDKPPDQVIEQSPAPGETAPTGLVVLTVSSAPEQATVPDVVGLDVSGAADAVREAGLQPAIRTVRSTERRGTVVAQEPSPGEVLESESVVRLEVATPPPEPASVEVPQLVGSTAAEARSRLREAGLRWAIVEVESQEPKGVVVRQSPGPGGEVRKGRVVELRVSTGPALAAVPDVVGLDEQTARAELESAGFTVEVVVSPTTDPNEDGLVVEQSPAGGTSGSQGTTVTLTVARY